jgi:phenylalanyl-tRNA synthetase alpha chain
MIIFNRLSFRSTLRPIFYHYRTNTTKTQKKSNPFNIEYDPEKQCIIYPAELILNNQSYPTDSWTNVNPHILSRIGQNLHRQKNHPLNHLANRLRQYFYQYYDSGKLSPKFSIIDNLLPIVTIEQNFDSLCVPIDHVSRTKSMNYYLNKNTLLRAHTSAHQVDLMRSGLNAFLCMGDVYRRDSIDPTHYPVFHQCEGVRLFNKEELFIANRNVLGEKDNLKIFESNGKKKNNSISNRKSRDR